MNLWPKGPFWRKNPSGSPTPVNQTVTLPSAETPAARPSYLQVPITEPRTYLSPEDGWVCFHCGERFTTVGSAEDHFGARPTDMAACLIKVGEERGLVMALRRVQAELRELRDNTCAICSQDPKNKRALADHKWLVHMVR